MIPVPLMKMQLLVLTRWNVSDTMTISVNGEHNATDVDTATFVAVPIVFW